MFDITTQINREKSIKSKSPYQPKLIQHLINSSDDQNSDSQNFDHINESQSQYEDQKSHQSFQTYQSNTQSALYSRTSTQVSKQKSNLSNVEKSSQNNQIYNILNGKSNSKIMNQNQNNPNCHSPMGIKYESLKLSQYNTIGMRKQQELYEKNMKEYKEKFNQNANSNNIEPSKINKSKFNSNKFNNFNSKNIEEEEIDSLQAMKKSTLTMKKKLPINNLMTQQKQVNNQNVNTNISLNEHLKRNEQLNSQIHEYQAEIQRLKSQLKRSKDVVKTLGLKNNDLQKSIELKTIRIQQLQSQYSQSNSRITIKHQKFNNNNHNNNNNNYYFKSISTQIREKINETYNNIVSYLKEKVRQFTGEIMNIKMSPLLEQSLQNFLAEIIQINQITVNKKLGIESDQFQQGNKQGSYKKLTNSFINKKNPINLDKENEQFCTNNSQFHNNKLYTNTQQTRQNNFLTTKPHYLSETNLNKQNITPNKKANTDEQFKQLQKSLQKLRNMQKQLVSTPVPKNTRNLTQKNEYYTVNSQMQRNQYSIINRSHISNNDLDRSKSRRKKIFAETHHK